MEKQQPITDFSFEHIQIYVSNAKHFVAVLIALFDFTPIFQSTDGDTIIIRAPCLGCFKIYGGAEGKIPSSSQPGIHAIGLEIKNADDVIQRLKAEEIPFRECTSSAESREIVFSIEDISIRVVQRFGLPLAEWPAIELKWS